MTGCLTFGTMSDAGRKMGLVGISDSRPVAAPHNEAGTVTGIRQIPGAGNLEHTAQSAASSTGWRVFLLSASAGLHLFNEACLVGVSRKQLG